ncbi:endospore germination permease [Wukongibacter baidiensis]|uniref:GerAB/ArcD/ProY family transporter n=1 Tax=Wukongibacter baidiensis TaxID=1723361 RepID=UPI003D7F2DA1
MHKENISDRQGISIIILFMGGSTFALGTGAGAKQDIWLSIIIALIFSFLAILIFGRLLSYYPKKNIFETIQNIFGDTIGKGICLLYIWYFFHLASLVLRHFAEFTTKLGLNRTPDILIKILFMTLIVWIVKEGIEVLGRWVSIFVLVLIGIEVISIYLKIPVMNISNLKPFLSNGLKPIIKSSFSTFTFPFAETIVFMSLFDSLKSRSSCYKVYILGLLLGGIAVFAAAVSEMMVLGQYSYSTSYFPTYATVARIEVGNIERIEAVVAMALLIGGFVKISVCLLACCKGLSSIFNFSDYKFIVTPIGFLSIILSTIIFESTMEMTEWTFNTYNYYAFPFQVILPIIMLIAVEIKNRQIKNVKE